MPDVKPLIKVENLDVIYFLGKSNQTNALTKINAEIYPGEFVIFFGPSGCGKSTLLNSIAGLEQVTHGEVFVNDQNLTKFNPTELEHYRQNKIGMIFQAYYLINSLPVLKNVTLPQLSLNTSIKEREEKAIQLLDHFGIKEHANKIPSELSGGQQQRVAISRSLINNPEIILADEPTGNLDSKSDYDVMELLRELNSKDKKTVILVTHSPTHLHYAHRVFFMKDGAILEIKVNRALYLTEQPALAGAQPLASKELEILTKTFASLTGATADRLIPIKAQEIVSETLTAMTTEEIENLNKKVEVMLQKRPASPEEIFKYLDEDEARGGLGLNKVQAQNLADKIAKIVAEIKILEQQEKTAKPAELEDAEVKSIRQYLFDTFDIKVAGVEAVWNVNRAIKERLEDKIDSRAVQSKFDLPVIQGGAGLDKRIARHAARRLELLILGKYNPDKQEKYPLPKIPTTLPATQYDKEMAASSTPVTPAPPPVIPAPPNVMIPKITRMTLVIAKITQKIKESLRAAGVAILGFVKNVALRLVELVQKINIYRLSLSKAFLNVALRLRSRFVQSLRAAGEAISRFLKNVALRLVELVQKINIYRLSLSKAFLNVGKKIFNALKSAIHFLLFYDLIDGTTPTKDITKPTESGIPVSVADPVTPAPPPVISAPPTVMIPKITRMTLVITRVILVIARVTQKIKESLRAAGVAILGFVKNVALRLASLVQRIKNESPSLTLPTMEKGTVQTPSSSSPLRGEARRGWSKWFTEKITKMPLLIGHFFKNLIIRFGDIIFYAAEFWGGKPKSKQTLFDSPLTPPLNLPLEKLNETAASPPPAKVNKTFFQNLTVVSEKELQLMHRVNHLLQKFISFPVKIFSWCKKIINKLIKKN